MQERVGFQREAGIIGWKLHLSSPPDTVYRMLSTDEGRGRFWAESTEERGNTLIFNLLNEPRRIEGAVLERRPGELYKIEYFAGSTAAFDLASDGSGGTDLSLTAEQVDEAFRMEMAAGWVTVLMSLKAATDFGIDLRNHDPDRTWDRGFLDD